MTALILLGVVLIVLGYRGSMAGAGGSRVRRALVAAALSGACEQPADDLAFYLYAASGMKTRITRVAQASAAHGGQDLGGGASSGERRLGVGGAVRRHLAWAVVSVILINRAEPRRPCRCLRPSARRSGAVVNAVVVTGVVMMIHNWLGVPPWG